MINILRNKVFTRALIIILSLISLAYWYGYMSLSKRSIPKDQYNLSHVEGVRLSKHQDLRGVIGSLNQRHQYGEYLSEASYYISRETGQRYLPDNISFPTWLRYVNNDKASLSTVPLVPIWNQDYILGFSNKSTFKILEKNILFQPGEPLKNVFVGKTAILKNDYADFYTTITDIDGSGNITVQGYIPFNFFPKSILIPSGKKKNKHMMFESDTMGWIRGGRFTLDPTGYTYVIRPVPSLSLSKTTLEDGDTLSWDGINGPTSTRIESVYGFNNTYIVKLDKKLPPYFDFRKNIITVTRNKDDFDKQEMLLNVDTHEINEKFFLGKKRNISFVVSSINDIAPGSVVVAEGNNVPLYVSMVAKDSNVITIDLFKSAVIKECLSTKSKQSYDSCLYNIDLSKFEYTNVKWAKENLANDKNFDGFGPWEMWNKGGALNIQYATNIVKRIDIPAENSKNENTIASKPPQKSLNGLIWEIYPGSLLNIFYGTHNPAPTEMLIHVLGREARDKYYSSFVKTKPEYISFAKPERFTPWLLNWHWPFFRNMINNYDLAVDKSEFSLWHLNNNNKWDDFGPEQLKMQGDFSVNKPIDLDISKSKTQSCDIKLMTAVVKYDIKNPISSLPLIGKLTRYLIEIENTGLPSNMPVSLPWSEHTFSFPIFYREGFNPTITPRTLSNFLNLTSLTIKEITLYQENVDAKNIYSLYYDYPAVGAAARYECNDRKH